MMMMMMMMMIYLFHLLIYLQDLVKKLLTKEVQARLGNLKGHPITTINLSFCPSIFISINLSTYLSLSIVSYHHLLLPPHFYPSLASIYISIYPHVLIFSPYTGGVDDIKNHPWFTGQDFNDLLQKKLKAPWLPKIGSVTDTSNFDPYGVDDHIDDGYVDHGTWDKDF
jgi:hypothetical protein